MQIIRVSFPRRVVLRNIPTWRPGTVCSGVNGCSHRRSNVAPDFSRGVASLTAARCITFVPALPSNARRIERGTPLVGVPVRFGDFYYCLSLQRKDGRRCNASAPIPHTLAPRVSAQYYRIASSLGVDTPRLKSSLFYRTSPSDTTAIGSATPARRLNCNYRNRSHNQSALGNNSLPLSAPRCRYASRPPD